MRPQILTQVGTGTSALAVLDNNRNPFSVSVAVDVTGTVSYSIEHSYDDPQLGASNMAWRSQTALTTKTASAEGGFTLPVRAVRINQASGAGTTKATILQAGHGPGG